MSSRYRSRGGGFDELLEKPDGLVEPVQLCQERSEVVQGVVLAGVVGDGRFPGLDGVDGFLESIGLVEDESEIGVGGW